METFGDKNLLKFCSKYYCNYCDYGTSKKSSYIDHNLSAKHKKRALGDDLVTNGDAKSAHILLNNYTCKNCDKQYISRNGLWKHNKTCITDNNAADIHEKELITMLVKQNTHLIEQNAELVKINDSLSYLDNLLYKK